MPINQGLTTRDVAQQIGGSAWLVLLNVQDCATPTPLFYFLLARRLSDT